MPSFTTTQFLGDLKVKCAIPVAGAQFTDVELLSIADQKMQSVCVPFVKALRQDFWRRSKTIPVVANQASYNIPSRSIGFVLADVRFLDPAGGQVSLAMIDPSNQGFWPSQASPMSNATAFYVQDNQIILVPTPNNAYGSVVVDFYTRPGKLVPTTSCAAVTVVGASTLTAASVPGTFVTGVTFDVVQASPNFGNPVFEGLSTLVAGAVVTFGASTALTQVTVGDFMCLTGESCVLQLPLEVHPMLLEATAVGVFQALGQNDSAGISNGLVEAMKNDLRPVLAPRVDGEPKKIMNYNGTLRSSWNGVRGWWR